MVSCYMSFSMQSCACPPLFLQSQQFMRYGTDMFARAIWAQRLHVAPLSRNRTFGI